MLLLLVLMLFWCSYEEVFSSGVVNGGWSEWGSWTSTCSQPCGEGTHTRWRYCDTPTPSFNGTKCVGSNTEKKSCYLKHCSGLAISNLGESCSLFCHNRGLSRGMLCSPILNLCGEISLAVSNCTGKTTRAQWIYPYEPVYIPHDQSCNGYENMPEQISCHEKPPGTQQRICRCYHQEDDLFREWMEWSDCSKTCDGGTQIRKRNCVNATNCQGINSQERDCNEMKCPVHGEPQNWSSWSPCTVSCGGGQQQRQRTCDNPAPKYGGRQCFNELVETKLCNVEPCQINGVFAEWTGWNECPVCSNQNNERYTRRYRSCYTPMYNGTECIGDVNEEMLCGDSSSVVEQCPKTSIYFNGILPTIIWKNQYFYDYSTDYEDLQNTIKQEFFFMFDDFHSSISHGIMDIRLASLSQASPGVRVLVELVFEALNHHQYLFLHECLETFSSARKLIIQKPFTLNINESYATSLQRWGVVPLDGVNILNSTSVINTTAVQIHWSKINQSNFEYNNTLHGGYTIFYRVDSKETTYSQRAVSHFQDTIVINNLNPATNYIFYVAASNAWGTGIPSLSVKLKTKSSLPVLPNKTPKVEIYEVITGEVHVFWEPVPMYYINGHPMYYNIYIENIKTGDVMIRKIPYLSVRQIAVTLIPSSLYSIRICPENEIGEGHHCMWELWQTLPSLPLWNDFGITIIPRTINNRIALSWKPIPLGEKRSDLVSYEIEYSMVQHNGYVVENPVTQTTTVPPSVTHHEFRDLSLGGQYKFRMKAVTTSGSGPWSSYTYALTCKCPFKLTTNYAIKEPYIYKAPDGRLVGVMKDIMEYIVKKTCGICRINGEDYFTELEWNYGGVGECQLKPTIEDVRASMDWSVHVSFPFFNHPDVGDVDDGKFLPVIQHPGSTFLHMSPDESKAVEKQMRQVLAVIPFVIILSLFIIISGIIVWVLERKSEYFSDRFSRGIFQGMYMTYVTLTTVGYGDKFAVTKPGRLFMLFWIMMSLILSGIFIGSISSVITTSSLHSLDVDIKSGIIAAITGSEDFKKGFHLGAHVNIDKDHHHLTYTTFEQLSNDLLEKKVDGILVDAYWVGKNMGLFSKPGMMIREIYEHKKWYGVLLNGPITSAADALKDTVMDNELQISLIYAKYKTDVKAKTEMHVPSLADEHAPQMQSALSYTFVLYVVFAVIGALAWYCGFRRWKRKHLSEATRARVKINRDCYRECRNLIESWNRGIHRRMERMEDRHTHERVYVWKNMKPGIVQDIRPINYNISTVKLNRSFLVN